MHLQKAGIPPPFPPSIPPRRYKEMSNYKGVQKPNPPLVCRAAGLV
jgi:hypothetical protein